MISSTKAVLRLAVYRLISSSTCSKNGFGSALFPSWWSKFGRIDSTEARRILKLGSMNSNFKRLSVETHFDIKVLKSVVGVTFVAQVQRSIRAPKVKAWQLFEALFVFLALKDV
jgi:hypothetical protein